MSNKIILFVVGIVLAFFAIWAGSALGIAAAPQWSGAGPQGASGAVVILGMISAAFIFFSVIFGTEEVVEGTLAMKHHVFLAALFAIAVGFVFGTLAQPIGEGAQHSWWTPWLILPIVGFTPMIVAGKTILKELWF